jgi:hypothetical protein
VMVGDGRGIVEALGVAHHLVHVLHSHPLIHPARQSMKRGSHQSFLMASRREEGHGEPESCMNVSSLSVAMLCW